MPSALEETRQEYIKRVNYVLDFIEQNLDADLSLSSLAEKAHYSSFHFHRIFSALVGESLSELINRKRMERIASVLLVDDHKPIKDLAYGYGFNSESAFSRAFKKHYGLSPTAFKKQGAPQLSKMGIVPLSTEKYIRCVDHLKKWLDMNAQITVKELPEIELAGMAQTGSFEEMGWMYQKLMEWGAQKEVLDMENFKAITLYHDNPHSTQAAKIRFSACVTVNQPIKAEGAIRPVRIEKGTYAVGSFEMEGKDFAKAWDSMCVWVLENGHDFRDSAYFEVYHNDHRNHPQQKFIVDICIPIENKKAAKEGKTARTTAKSCPTEKPNNPSNTAPDYHQLIGYMRELKAFFAKAHDTEFLLGTIYQGSRDFSYFSLTTQALKKDKLKFVIILDHASKRFRICLSGQNKSIRRKYWKMFKDSNWNKYPLVTSIDDSLFIMDQMLIEKADFDDLPSLLKRIESESLKFINELKAVLE